MNKAVQTTIQGHSPEGGDRRAGVVWHTQGSGKSLTMVFYAGRLVLEPEMQNPTIVVITDRNDLDDQLFGTFSRCSELLRQTARAGGGSRAPEDRCCKFRRHGIVFTTIQKFMPWKANATRNSPIGATSW